MDTAINTYRHDDIEITTGCKVPIKGWTVGVEIEQHARAQLVNVANLPFIFKHVSVMPDCLHINTEVLTSNGFVKISDLILNDMIANFDPKTELISFSKPKAIILRPLRQSEKVYEYRIDTLKKSIIVTENHRMPVIGQEGIIANEISNLVMKDFHWGGSGVSEKTTRNISLDEILFLLWFWGDGSIKTTHNNCSDNKRIRFGFKKQRKIKRVQELLYKLGLKYTISVSNKQTEICLDTKSSARILQISPNKKIDWSLITSFNPEEAVLVIDEAVSIDGDYINFKKLGSRRLNSKRKEFMDFMSAIIAIYFGIANRNFRHIKGYKPTDIYYTSAIPKQHLKLHRTGMHNRKIIRKEIAYKEDVVCLECNTGFFIARQNGMTFVTGNCHAGKGATVGCVIPTVGAIIPSAAGVDLGCGLIVVRTTLRKDMLPKDLAQLRAIIEAAVPHGFTKGRDEGSWGDIPTEVNIAWMELEPGYKKIIERTPRTSHKGPEHQLGTLGSGNHMLEIVYDETDQIWLLLHSGSRGVGNSMASCFIDSAKADMKRYHIELPDAELAYIPEGAPGFDPYLEAVNWCQRYALVNRELMAEAALRAIKKSKLVPKFEYGDETINCHHNYVTRENHYGKNIFVTRKGAISARKGQAGVICGSMGTPSFIVSGLGCEESFTSASHGAGRRMSRTAAKQQITLKDHREATEGIECRKDSSVLDESPAAYKDIFQVLEAEKTLVEPIHKLRQLICIKG